MHEALGGDAVTLIAGTVPSPRLAWSKYRIR